AWHPRLSTGRPPWAEAVWSRRAHDRGIAGDRFTRPPCLLPGFHPALAAPVRERPLTPPMATLSPLNRAREDGPLTPPAAPRPPRRAPLGVGDTGFQPVGLRGRMPVPTAIPTGRMPVPRSLEPPPECRPREGEAPAEPASPGARREPRPPNPSRSRRYVRT